MLTSCGYFVEVGRRKGGSISAKKAPEEGRVSKAEYFYQFYNIV